MELQYMKEIDPFSISLMYQNYPIYRPKTLQKCLAQKILYSHFKCPVFSQTFAVL